MVVRVTIGGIVVVGSVVDEGNGAVVTGGTGVTMDVSESTKVDDVSMVDVIAESTMRNLGLMLPELPKTSDTTDISIQRTR